VSELLAFSCRAAILLLPALAVARFSRRLSASSRHALCFAALLTVLALPLLSALLPEVRLAWLPAARPGPLAVSGGTTGATFLAGLWLGGVLVVGGRILSGVVRARMLCRLAREVSDARVLSAAIRVRREIGLSRPIRVLFQKRLGVPFTWGFARPIVLLPARAATWGPSRLRAVLLHELTHVKRHDCLTQLLADSICAVYWFHPLVWLAAARMREERENACDDSVVGRGARPSSYASLLVRMVESVRYGGLAAEPVAAFGGGRGLTGRLRVLLGRRRDRRALSASSLAAFALGALTLMLPIAVVRITRASPEPAPRVEVVRMEASETRSETTSEPVSELEFMPVIREMVPPTDTPEIHIPPRRYATFRVFAFVRVHVQVGRR
jgi:beta-lactamase regulating signal transducer with metallopeptidase domain